MEILILPSDLGGNGREKKLALIFNHGTALNYKLSEG